MIAVVAASYHLSKKSWIPSTCNDFGKERVNPPNEFSLQPSKGQVAFLFSCSQNKLCRTIFSSCNGAFCLKTWKKPPSGKCNFLTFFFSCFPSCFLRQTNWYNEFSIAGKSPFDYNALGTQVSQGKLDSPRVSQLEHNWSKVLANDFVANTKYHVNIASIAVLNRAQIGGRWRTKANPKECSGISFCVREWEG